MGVCGTGEDNFTLRVAQLSEGGCGHVERHRYLGTEHGCGEIDMLDVNENSGAEPNLVEGRVVFPHSLDRLVVSICWWKTNET